MINFGDFDIEETQIHSYPKVPFCLEDIPMYENLSDIFKVDDRLVVDCFIKGEYIRDAKVTVVGVTSTILSLDFDRYNKGHNCSGKAYHDRSCWNFTRTHKLCVIKIILI